jgi:hypothetical protein
MIVSFSFVPELSAIKGQNKKGQDLRKDLQADPFACFGDKAGKMFLQQEFNENHCLSDQAYQPSLLSVDRFTPQERHFEAIRDTGKLQGKSIPPASFSALLALELNPDDFGKLNQAGVRHLVIPNRVILKQVDEPIVPVLSLSNSGDKIVLKAELARIREQKWQERKWSPRCAFVFMSKLT